MRFEKVILEYYRYLCHPRINLRNAEPMRMSQLIALFLLLFVIEMVIAAVLFSWIGLEDSSHKFDDLLNQFSLWSIFLMAVILAPIMEEIMFRYYINKPLVFVIGLFIAVGIALSFLMIKGILSLYIGIPLIILIIALSINERIIKWMTNQYERYFPYMFYLSAVIFAYVHVFNFESHFSWYMTPALVFPQFFLGLYLGYVRIRNGLKYSMLIHAINNMIPMIMIMIAPDQVIG